MRAALLLLLVPSLAQAEPSNNRPRGFGTTFGALCMEGATVDDFEVCFSATDPTADRTLTLPNESGTLALSANVLALSGGTITGNISLNDDVELRLGTGVDYWWEYNSTDTRLELWSTDVAGPGTNGKVLYIEDGNDNLYMGAVGAAILFDGDQGTPNDYINAPNNNEIGITLNGGTELNMTTTLSTFSNSITSNGTIASTRTTDIGWSVVNAANQACNTTCTNACVVGLDTAAVGNFLLCTDATADTCICAGAN